MSGNYPAQGEANPARLVQSIRDLFAGRNNCSGSFTLALTPATETVVRAPNSSPNSIPFLTPLNEAAAVEYGAGTMWISARGAGQFTIMHSASADARTFGYTALG